VNCEDYQEDIEAYVLGALDDVTARRLRVHAAECATCEERVRAYRFAVDYLALSAPVQRAPIRLKERVMGMVGVYRPRITPRMLLQSSRWWAAAAVLFLAFAIGSIVWAFSLSSRVDDLRADNQRLAELTQLDADQRNALLRLQSELNSTRNEQRRMVTTLEEQATLIVLALDPDLIPTELQGTTLAPTSSCRYVWSTQQALGALTCQNLPAIGFTLTYDLWMLKGGQVIHAGAFSPRPDGTGQLLVKLPPNTPEGPVDNIWVTLESASPLANRPSSEVILNRAPSHQAAR
jgi:hypothetical protein